ncbi:ATP-binding protein [Pseudosporangium ferrugineum]|uniref:AAA ATPase-like protein n=1 Tax=Pseudosporangium ferrugineum TaxID=439699 RepID=A0A2T0RIS1_9ACTN|nr:ATP-binding protein [Pseudosporangium ferrugineum]PRY21027.1 AAA ATPase-like protein [Pseudosporangium ferrugineum]
MFIGRAAQLRAIEAEIDAAAEGAARAVHLVGEAGIGKTSLARRAAAEAESRGFTVSWGCAWGGALAPPYWLWSQVLDDLDVPLPEPDADQGPAARAMLLRAFLNGMRVAASGRPLLIVLDDLHDADPASLMLTGALLRSLPHRALLLVSTQRPGHERLDEVNREGVVMPVPAFGAEDIAELIAGCSPADPVDAGALLRLTGGNPFYAVESLRTGAESAAGRRLGALRSSWDDDTGRVVSAAAVLGPCPAPGLIAAVADLPPVRCTAALTSAVSAGLLDEHHRFRHALLQEHCYASIPVAERVVLHAAAADAIDRVGAALGQAAALAHHRRAAVLHGDPAVAVDATCAAARVALHAYAPEDAVAQCTAGLACIAAYGNEATTWRARLLTLRGEAEAMAGDPLTGWRSLTEAIGLASAAADPVLVAEAALRLPRRERFLLHDPELGRHVADALDGLGTDHPALRVRLLTKLAYDSAMSDDDAAGQDIRNLATADQVVAQARAVGDPGLLAEALSTKLFASWAPETLDDRLTLGPEIARLGRRTGDLSRELDGLLWQFMAEVESGRIDDAHTTLAGYTFRAERGGRPDHLAFARSRAAAMASLRGRYEEAERLADAAREHSHAAGSPDTESLYLTQLGAWAWARGGETAERLLDAYRSWDARANPLMSVVMYLYLDRPEAARLPLRATKSMLAHTPGPPRLFGYKILAEAAFLLDERDLAADLYERMLPFPDRCVISSGGAAAHGAINQALGVCAMTIGDLDAAVRWLRSAIDQNRSYSADPYVAASQADLADALLRRNDDPAEAAGLLAEAAATAERLGMDRLSARVGELRKGLPDDDRALARTIAVLGADADRSLLAAACGLPPERFLAAVARAPLAPPDITPDERRADLLRAAAAIDRLGLRRRYLGDVARYRLEALPAGDPATAVGAALEAAREALHRFRPAEAAERCTTALDAIAPYADQARGWRAELLTVLGTAQADAGARDAATRTLTEAADLADLAGVPEVAIDAVLGMPLDARFEIGSCGPVESALRARLDTAPAAHRARLLARLGADALAARPGAVRERERLVDQAVDEAHAIGDGPLLVTTLAAWLRTVLGPDRIQQRLTRGAETVDLARRHGRPAGELQARLSLFTALLTTGRIEQAEAELHQYEKLATRIDAPLFRMYAHSRRATLATLRGEFADAERLIRDAHRAGGTVTPDAHLLYGLQVLALGWARGRIDDEACLASVRRTAPAHELIVGYLLHKDGRLHEARQQLRASMKTLDVMPPGFELFGLTLVTGLAHRLGDAEAAAELRSRLTPYAHHVAVAGTGSVCLGSVARPLGLCAATTGDLDAAAALLRQALAVDRGLGALPFVAAGAHELAAVLARRNGPGDPAEASALRAEAEALAARLGVTLRPEASAPAPGGVTLSRQGDSWCLTCQGRTATLRHSKGIAQLAVLLAHPGRDIPAIELAGGIGGTGRTPVLDDAAKLAYRNRIAALKARMAEGDDATAAGREYAFLVRTLKQATGLRGRTRLISDEDERARVNVTRTLRKAIDHIVTVDEAAGLYLHGTISTGIRCRFEPA